MNYQKRSILYFFTAGLLVVGLFQNCGKASIEGENSVEGNAASSDTDPVVIPDPDDGGDGGLQLDLSAGDSLSYIQGRTMVPHEKSMTLLRAFGRVLAVTQVHEPFQLPAPSPLNLDALPFSQDYCCLLYTSPSPRDRQKSRMPSSA